ncbi:MAG: rRNA pseudouridine synthase [Ignavibacteria bacterium]|nr:MAG: rRNA pseudouridine synthase [Ignavibacteria bacterium]
MKIRLNKYLSQCGLASRRKSEELIEQGRVEVNGKVVIELGATVDPEKDEILVDGEKIKPEKKVYFILNKPKNVVTTTVDEKHRRTVVDLINTDKKIFPVGRLDYDTTGILLLTNDGEFANRLLHPKNNFKRTYIATLDKSLEVEDKLKLLKGIFIQGGRGKFDEIKYPKKNNFKIVEVTVSEGRNHFVKNMFLKLGYQVKKLHRKYYAGLTADNMKQGEYRKLSDSELKSLLS